MADSELAEKWLDSLKETTDFKTRPKIIPAIGVTIECRIILEKDSDWSLVQDVLNQCRCHGAAEVVGVRAFEE